MQPILEERPTMAERMEIIDGRQYIVKYSPDDQRGAFVTVGPPEGLVDELGLEHEVANKLHQVLFDRRIFTYAQIANDKVARGVCNEVPQVTPQALVQAFFNYEKE